MSYFKQVTLTDESSVPYSALTDAELRDSPVDVSIVSEDDTTASPLDVRVVDESEDELIDTRYAMDKANNMPMFVEVANPEKRDAFGANVPSDAPVSFVISGLAAENNPLIIDTTGYQSIVIQNWGATTVTPRTSNTGQTWLGMVGFVTTAPQTQITAVATATIGVFPVTARFIRVAAGAGQSNALVVLRQIPAPSISQLATVGTVTTLTQFGGTNIVTAGVAGMLAVGGNIASGTAPTANPVQVGGVDAGRLYSPGMAAANLSAKTRRALTDEQGRFIPPNVDLQLNGNQNIQGTATANVRDVDVREGDTVHDLLWQILVELRVLNFQLKEMGGNTCLPDDLESIRTDMVRAN